jgi:pimeloyl-ACP methyl ester carboxylesterase
MYYSEEVTICVDDTLLKGNLVIPLAGSPVIIFSHGSGSSRLSPRNLAMAEYLNGHGFGTLLFDLLTEQENRHSTNRFDIDLLTRRLIGATRWLQSLEVVKDAGIGYFGASTGAASALCAAAKLKEVIAVVSRGGRPDMALDSLKEVEAPTLLIVGSLDKDVLELNKNAFSQLRCIKALKLVEGATHLFEEEGAMEQVEQMAERWFEKFV